MPLSDRKTILLVDSSPTDVRVYSRALSDAGYRPITTLIGTDYLGFHQYIERPALILLDAGPKVGVSAVIIAQVLRDIFPASPIVLFSMSGAPPLEMTKVTEGFLQKGDPGKLVAMVRGILSKGTEATDGAATS